jgi:hypothetical protein
MSMFILRYGRSALSALAASLVFAAASPGQRVLSTVDLSGTSVWYADSVHAGGGSISPAVRLDWPRATVSAAAALSRLQGGGTSLQAALNPSVFTPAAGVFSGELAASLGGSTHEDGTHTGQLLGVARGYVMNATAGAWLGGGAGRTWDGATWQNVRQFETGAWADAGAVTMLASVTPVVAEDTIRYTDFQAAMRYPTHTVELGLSVGGRAGAVGEAVGGSSRVWGSVSVLAWLSQRMAVVANAGSYPVDLTQGYPGGRFATIALRIATPNARPVAMAVGSESATDTRSVATAIPRFEVRAAAAAGDERVLRVFAPSAHVVEISGDFTNWQPLRLARDAGGWWSASRRIAAGTYEMNVRIDGGAWLVPSGLLSTADEFGGVVGVLTLK